MSLYFIQLVKSIVLQKINTGMPGNLLSFSLNFSLSVCFSQTHRPTVGPPLLGRPLNANHFLWVSGHPGRGVPTRDVQRHISPANRNLTVLTKGRLRISPTVRFPATMQIPGHPFGVSRYVVPLTGIEPVRILLRGILSPPFLFFSKSRCAARVFGF